MRAHAIVIGIDAYEGAAPQLTAAVADACRFASWALEHGGVAPADLLLLLAPIPGATPPVPAGVEPTGATCVEILDALDLFVSKGRGLNDQRLYFYFAGHGLAGAAAAHVAMTEPVIVPVDYARPQVHSHLLIGFSRLFSQLRQHGPREHIFFVDACRDFSAEGLMPAPGQAVVYVPPPSLAQQAKQCVLYGTSMGRKATEQEGAGVFTGALVEALRGHGVDLAYSYERSRFLVRFEALAMAVVEAVRQRGGGAQVPEPRFLGDGGVELTDLGLDAVPIIDVHVLVQPTELGRECRVQVLEFSKARRTLVATAEVPLDHSARGALQLPPGTYALQARGPGVGGAASLRVIGAPGQRQNVPLRVARVNADLIAPSLEAARPVFGLNVVAAPDTRAEPTDGHLVVTFRDTGLEIAVSRGSREVARGFGVVNCPQLSPGVYTVTVDLTGRRLRNDVLVLAGARVSHQVALSEDLRDRTDLEFLQPGVKTDDGFVTVEGCEFALASPPLTEVLALVAAVRLRPSPVQAETTSRGRVVLVAAMPDEPDRVGEIGAALDRPGGARVTTMRTASVLGEAGVVLEATVEPGAVEVRVDLPGIVRTNLAAVVPESGTLAVVVVLRREDDGSRSAVVHLAHLGRDVPLDVVRDFDRAQHALRRGPTPGVHLLARGLASASVAPLFSLLAAMSVADLAAFRADLELSLATLTQVEPAIAQTADVALLRGASAEGRFAVTARAARKKSRVVGRELLPGATWATWIQERPVLPFADVHGRATRALGPMPPSWEAIESSRALLEASLPAIGILLGPEGPVATIFLIEPDLAVVPSFALADRNPRVIFHGDQLGAELLHSDQQSFVALIRLARAVDAQPLRVADALPRVASPRPACLLALYARGRAPIGLAASPGMIRARAPARSVPVMGAHSAGEPIHVALLHDCASAPGSAGGPLIDLTTGTVVGMHHSGEAGLRRMGVASALVRSTASPVIVHAPRAASPRRTAKRG